MMTTAEAQLADQLVAAVEGEVSHPPSSFFYRIGLGLVALTMVFLPLVYVGLIGAVIYAVGYHVVHSISIFETGRLSFYIVLIYIAPLVAGSILILFMIKPLFARHAKQAPPRKLDPESEPKLSTFVNRIATAVGATAPSEIRVDCQVNASASFRSGPASFLRNDLVLTIGLPLVAGMNLRQLGGILAHEFGHFSQGAGMRLSYVIRSVNHWFARVVHERDVWDVQLERWSQEADLRIGLMLHLARLMVWITRRILQGLMLLGNLISCFMLRQMEFDADRYEAGLAGSDTFEITSLRMHLINAATQLAYEDLRTSWSDRRLADDLPGLIRHRLERIPEEVVNEIKERSVGIRTRLLDTHPCDADRIRNASRMNSHGVFHLDLPAVVLFHDFGLLSRQMTLDHYETLVGPGVKKASLVASEQLASGRDDHNAALALLAVFFMGAIKGERLVYWPDPGTEDADESTAIAGIEGARFEMKRGARQARDNFDAWFAAETRIVNGICAEELLEAGVDFKAGSPRLSRSSIDDVKRAINEARSQQDRYDSELAPYRQAAERRLTLALSLAARANSSASSAIGSRCAVLRTLRPLVDRLKSVRYDLAAIATLLRHLEDEASIRGAGRVRCVAERMHDRLKMLQKELARTHYPYDHADAAPTIADAVVGQQVPDVVRFGELCQVVQSTCTRLYMLYYRALGDLVRQALEAEARSGFNDE